MVELSDLILELSEFNGQLYELINMPESLIAEKEAEIDESIDNCRSSLTLLSEQLAYITSQLEIRDKEVMILKCHLEETTKARDSLAKLIKYEAKLENNEKDELDNVLKMNQELEKENKNLISRLNEKQSLLDHIQSCEHDIDKQLKMKSDLLSLEKSRNLIVELRIKTDELQSLKTECQRHLKVIDDLKSNMANLEGLQKTVERMEFEKNSLLLEIDSKELRESDMKRQLQDKDKLIRNLTDQLGQSSERCRRLESELNNMTNNCRSLANENKDLILQLKKNTQYFENSKTIAENNVSSSECSQTELSINKSEEVINENNKLLSQLQEANKNLLIYKTELDISKDTLKSISSQLFENKKTSKQKSAQSIDGAGEKPAVDLFKEKLGEVVSSQLISTRSVGVITDCDEKTDRKSCAEELLMGLISRLGPSREKSRIEKFSKKVKSIDDLRRLQSKAGQMTEQNVRDILIEVKKFYATTISDMQNNFKGEFDKLCASHEMSILKMRAQNLEKINLLKKENNERVNKILSAHEEEIKKIGLQQRLIQSITEKVNKSNKVPKKK